VINFVGVMSSLLTSFVTNPNNFILTFVLSIVYLFGVFFLYFRVLYWALRLEANALFLWFYFFSILLFAYFAFFISQSLGLVSILAQPLAPGSQLPVKINPIFPVILLSMVAMFYLFCIVMLLYFISSALYWHRISDNEKLELYKKQNKRKWLRFFGNKGSGFDADEGDENSWKCIMMYEKVDDDYLSEIDLNTDKKKRKKKKKPKKPTHEPGPRLRAGKHEVLSIPGKLTLHPSQRKLTFESNEAIFNNVFQMSTMLINVVSIKKRGTAEIDVLEKYYRDVVVEDEREYLQVTATCGQETMVFRILKFDFDIKKTRDRCFKRLTKVWRAIKKKEEDFFQEDNMSLKSIRLDLARRARERSAQHLLTHKDWKLLVSMVWRRNYKSGEVIIEKETRINELVHITEGTVTIYLETKEDAQRRTNGFMDEDFDLQSSLFHNAADETEIEIPKLDASMEGPQALNKRRTPEYYKVRFEKRKLGFSYIKKRRSYNLADFEDLSQKHFQMSAHTKKSQKTFKNNYAAVVHSVKEGGEAHRFGVQVNDELVKVGFFDIEQAELSQASITSFIKDNTYPLEMTFRRPPEIEFEVDEAGFINPDPVLVPSEVRDLNNERNQMDKDYGQIPRMVLGDPGDASSRATVTNQDVSMEGRLFGRTGARGSVASIAHRSSMGSSGVPVAAGYLTSDEEEESDDDFKDGAGFGDNEVDLISFSDEVDLLGNQKQQQQKKSSGAVEMPQEESFQFARITAPPGSSFEMSRLDLAEEYAANASRRARDDTTIEFDATRPSAPPHLRRVSDLNPFTENQMRRSGHHRSQASRMHTEDTDGEVGVGASGRGILERGRTFLFGNAFKYNKIEEESIRNMYARKEKEDESGGISIIVEDADDGGDGGDKKSESSESETDYFSGIPTYEPVGRFQQGDTIGIIPWILNHPVSVVRLVAEHDVVVHAISTTDIAKLFRKNGTLALSFFKYVTAVIGERADRDEEHLCDELSRDLVERGLKAILRRALDDKPIRSTTPTGYEMREELSKEARHWFENDFDMRSDSVIDSVECEAQLVGDISILIGKSWHGQDTRKGTEISKTSYAGVFYLTHFHVCFRSKKRALDLAKLKRRPTLYGKLHIDDVYEMRRSGDNGQRLSIITDDIRLDVLFHSAQKAQYIEDWISALLASGTVVEQAPHSYTLPGDLYGFSSHQPQPSDVPEGVDLDPLNILYSQQRDLRTEFLILTQTLQQVLTKQDRFKLFHDKKNVIVLKKNQSVVAASRTAASSQQSDADSSYKRRPQASKRALEADGPNGLYLVGKGELVLQREVNGRRIQFASYKVGTVFGVERFLTGAPSPFTVKVVSKTAHLKFAPRDRVMALLRSDLPLAARFYQYCALLQMQRLRGPILSRPLNEEENLAVARAHGGTRGCVIL